MKSNQNLIPSKDFSKSYINRYFDGFIDIDILEYAHASQKNTLLFGPTGPGKTSMLYAYASKHQIPVATIQCNGGADIHAVFGGNVMDEDGKITYVESDVISVIRSGGILYFDELNFLPPRLSSVFHGLFDFRRSIVVQDKQNELITAHPDLMVVASYNPGYEGTRALNEALKNRFHIKLHCDYDPTIELQLVDSEKLVEIAQNIRKRFGAGISTPVSTNMLQEFVEQSREVSFQFALMNFVNAFDEEEREGIAELLKIHAEVIASGIGVKVNDDDELSNDE